MIRIKNWGKHQHFKNRRPPWIKVYRDLLDDMHWFSLSGDDAKMLLQLWLIASEDETLNGFLPEDTKNTAFRLRVSEDELISSLNRLSRWLIHDDINAMTGECQVDIKQSTTRCHDDAPEGEGEADFPAKEKEYINSTIYGKGQVPQGGACELFKTEQGEIIPF